MRPALPACWHARLIDQESLEGCKPTRKPHIKVLCRCYWRCPNLSLSTCSIAKRSSRAARPRTTKLFTRPRHRSLPDTPASTQNTGNPRLTSPATPAMTGANHSLFTTTRCVSPGLPRASIKGCRHGLSALPPPNRLLRGLPVPAGFKASTKQEGAHGSRRVSFIRSTPHTTPTTPTRPMPLASSICSAAALPWA